MYKILRVSIELRALYNCYRNNKVSSDESCEKYLVTVVAWSIKLTGLHYIIVYGHFDQTPPLEDSVDSFAVNISLGDQDNYWRGLLLTKGACTATKGQYPHWIQSRLHIGRFGSWTTRVLFQLGLHSVELIKLRIMSTWTKITNANRDY